MPRMRILGRKTVKAEKTSAPMIKAGGKSAVASGGGASKGRHAPTNEEIATRSYEIFLARGGESGHEVEDWLQAEAELSGK
jgi:Protein of unknown function (DUF2934)